MSNQIEVVTLQSYPHHNMLNYCENRPKYRQGRKLTAVKVLELMSLHIRYCILELLICSLNSLNIIIQNLHCMCNISSHTKILL